MRVRMSPRGSLAAHLLRVEQAIAIVDPELDLIAHVDVEQDRQYRYSGDDHQIAHRDLVAVHVEIELAVEEVVVARQSLQAQQGVVHERQRFGQLLVVDLLWQAADQVIQHLPRAPRRQGHPHAVFVALRQQPRGDPLEAVAPLARAEAPAREQAPITCEGLLGVLALVDALAESDTGTSSSSTSSLSSICTSARSNASSCSAVAPRARPRAP